MYIYKKKSIKKKTIKIISGKLKSHKIIIKKNILLKPTKNLIKETLFNWLSKNIKGSKCLDCFAGSGSLGIEAISRGAKFVTFIESNKTTLIRLIENLKKLKIYNITKVIYRNILSYINQKSNPYDIIFIDPPFNNKIINSVIFYLEKNKWININSLIYIEIAKNQKNVQIPKNWSILKKSISGNVSYYLYICRKI